MSANAVFGKKTEPHTIIIARGQSVSHFTVRPWVAALVGAVIAAVCFGYLAATSYLVFRDDLLTASMARQARLQHTYEDRISVLRAQVDRITSHRLLDQQVMETKLAELMSRQNVLAQRAGVSGSVMERALKEGLVPSAGPAASDLPTPALRPGTERAEAPLDGTAPAAYAAATGIDPVVTGSVQSDTPGAAPPGKVRNALSDMNSQLAQLETAQLLQLQQLREAAHDKAIAIAQAAQKAGLDVKPALPDETASGGPLLPPLPGNGIDGEAFSDHIEALDAALAAIDQTRDRVRAFPIANPAPGRSLTSRFGNRKDPITGGRAFHAGLDFRTPTGTPILASADGEVIHAGRMGGYGNLVELRHANGLKTRYAHLSKIKVKKGQRVDAGMMIGAAGSTGRSTGPHLHYEVRSGERALDPMRYLNAGKQLADQL